MALQKPLFCKSIYKSPFYTIRESLIFATICLSPPLMATLRDIGLREATLGHLQLNTLCNMGKLLFI